MNDLHQLAADLTRAGSQTQARARLVVEKSTLDIESDAKNLAPVDTGNLRSSIGHMYHYEDGAVEAEIGPTADYGAYVELGTSVHAPQPYMAPALERRTPGFIQAMRQLGGTIL